MTEHIWGEWVEHEGSGCPIPPDMIQIYRTAKQGAKVVPYDEVDWDDWFWFRRRDQFPVVDAKVHRAADKLERIGRLNGWFAKDHPKWRDQEPPVQSAFLETVYDMLEI